MVHETDEWDRAGGESSYSGIKGREAEDARPVGERGPSIDEDTAEQRERRNPPARPAHPVDHDNESVGGAEGTSVGGGDVETAPDPMGT